MICEENKSHAAGVCLSELKIIYRIKCDVKFEKCKMHFMVIGLKKERGIWDFINKASITISWQEQKIMHHS